MRLILNVIWLVLCGLWMAILYAVAGLICFILIITIPFGIAAFRIAAYVLWPFGRTTEVRRDSGVGSLIGNILWILLFGWWLALGHLVSGVLLCLTIIGIPLGLASFKIIPITLVPLGVRIVPERRSQIPAPSGVSPGLTPEASARGLGPRRQPEGVLSTAGAVTAFEG